MQYFIELKTLPIKDRLPGATAAYFPTEFLTVAFTELKAGAVIPLHNHVQEAVDIVLEGELEMQIAEEINVLKPGMISWVPSNVFHTAKAIKDSKIVTLLHPKR